MRFWLLQCFLFPVQAASARDIRINSTSGFPCLHSACSASTTSAVMLRRRLPLPVCLWALLSPLCKVWEMLLRCVHTHSWDIVLSRLQLPSSSYSLFCSSKGTCCVEVTLSRPQLQREGERKEVGRETEHFSRGWRKADRGEGRRASLLQLSWMHNFSLSPFFVSPQSSLHIVSCADILFSLAVAFWASQKAPVLFFSEKPIKHCAFYSVCQVQGARIKSELERGEREREAGETGDALK